MSELISKDAALDCFHDWIDQYGREHAADEDATYQRIAELPAVQPDHIADSDKKVSISCGHENDLISRQEAIDAVGDWIYNPEDLRYHKDVINSIPAVQPDRAIIDDCLHHIYKNISVHTATGGVIAIRYYMEKLYEEIYGEGERPWWMK